LVEFDPRTAPLERYIKRWMWWKNWDSTT
jgi:hypothetical protein